MSVTTITENGRQVTIQTIEKTDHLGATYWQGRAMFRVAGERARVDVITSARHQTSKSAEASVLALARRNGWGAS